MNERARSRRAIFLSSWLCLCTPAAHAFAQPVESQAEPAPQTPPREPQAEPAPEAPASEDATATTQPAEAPPATPPVISAEDEAALREALEADQAGQAEDAPEASAASTGPGEGDDAVAVPSASSPGVQSLNPDLSFIADFALAAFSDEDRQRQAGAHDPRRNGFNLQQLELSVGAAVDPYFRFDANIVFAEFGVEIEEAYATTLDLPAQLQVRAGQFLTRFGRMNPTHPHAWDFVDQPFAIGRLFGGEGNRGLGAELSWLSPLPWYVELIGSTTMAGGEATARSFYGGNDQGVKGPEDLLYVAAIKQFFPLDDDWSLAWGLSGAFGPNGTGRDNRSEVYGTDLYLKWRPISYQSFQIVSLHSEWFYRRRQVPLAVHQDVSSFTQLVWRFSQRWGTAARYEYGSPTWDTRFDRVVDDLDPDWTGPRHRVAAALTFWPTEFSRLRLQPSADVAEWEDDPVYALFLAFEVVTGAHGAHTF